MLKFSGVEEDSMHELNEIGPVRVKEVSGRYTLRVETDTSKLTAFRGSAYREAVKKHEMLKFEPLANKIREPGEIVVTDWSKPDSSQLGLLAYRALWAVSEGELDKIPRIHNSADANAFVEKMRQINEEARLVETVSEEYGRVFSMTARGELPPVVTFMGGVVCQEALKACSGKYTPVKQWMFYDAQESLSDGFEKMAESEFTANDDNKKYDKVVGVVGRESDETLSRIHRT